jgi:hypothetical protein
MKRTYKSGRTLGVSGYTIVEAIIFLAVSGALLVSTMMLFNGKDQRTRFSQGIATVEQDLQDLMNDISTGYYPSAANFKCEVLSGVITFGSTNVEQGKNTGCAFIGKIIELSPGEQYNAYTMVGLQDATSLSNAGTKLLGVGLNPGIVDRNNLSPGIAIEKLISAETGNTQYPGLAIVSDFAQVVGADNSVSGNAARITLYAYTYNFTDPAVIGSSNFIPVTSKGLILCFKEVGIGTSKKGALIIGSSGQLSIERKLDSEVPTECS